MGGTLTTGFPIYGGIKVTINETIWDLPSGKYNLELDTATSSLSRPATTTSAAAKMRRSLRGS